MDDASLASQPQRKQGKVRERCSVSSWLQASIDHCRCHPASAIRLLGLGGGAGGTARPSRLRTRSDAVASFERRPGRPTTAAPSHQIPAGVGLRRPSHPRGNAIRQRGSRGRPSAPRLTGRIRECEIRSVRMRNKHDAEISLLPRPRGLSPSEGSRYAALLRCCCGREQWRLASVFEGRLIRL